MFKKISAFFVMLLFVVNIVPAVFGAETISLTSGEPGPTEIPVDGFFLELKEYVEVNSEKLGVLDLEMCIKQLKKKFPKLLESKAKEYCGKAKGLKGFKGKLSRLGISKEGKAVLMKVPAKDFKKVGSLEKAEVQRLTELKPAKIKSIASLSRSEIKSLVKGKRSLEVVDVGSILKEKQDFKKKALRIRKIPQIKLVANAKSIKKSNELYVSAKNKLKKVKVDFASAKKKYKACVGDSSEKCINIKKNLAVDSKEYLNNLDDMIIENVKKVRLRVQSSEKLTDEQVEEILERGAVLIGNGETIKEKIAGINADTSKESIREVANVVKAEFKNVKKFVKKVKSLMQERIVAKVLVKFDALESRLERVLERMEEEGMETTKIDELLDQFSENIFDARFNYQEGLKAQDNDDDDAMKYFAISKEAFKDAKTTLKEIVKFVKSEGGWQILQNTPDEEPEEIEVVEEIKVVEETTTGNIVE